jgi:hypothetical protein
VIVVAGSLALTGVATAFSQGTEVEGRSSRVPIGEFPGSDLRAPWASARGVAAHFPDGAPARVTGGFGEDSCYACHWNGPENDGEGALRISGFPERYEAGRRYPLVLEVERDGMAVAGFQMAVRGAADTVQGGTFSVPPGEEDRVTVVTDRDVEFAQHLEGGTTLNVPGYARWTVTWTAPPDRGPLALHASAVAGDGDRSQMGDHVYTLERISRPKSP